MYQLSVISMHYVFAIHNHLRSIAKMDTEISLSRLTETVDAHNGCVEGKAL